jgi:hypothetical protein
MKAKLLLALAALAAAAALIAGWYLWLGVPGGTEDQKTVTVEIIVERENLRHEALHTTSAAYLKELLQEQPSLRVTGEDSQYGWFVTGILGVAADPKSEFYNIKIDGVDATAGVSSIPVEDGRTYTFTLTRW